MRKYNILIKFSDGEEIETFKAIDEEDAMEQALEFGRLMAVQEDAEFIGAELVGVEEDLFDRLAEMEPIIHD